MAEEPKKEDFYIRPRTVEEAALWARTLPQHAYEEYHRAYEESTGEKISFAEAKEMAIEVFSLYRILYGPTPSEAEAHNKHVDEDWAGVEKLEADIAKIIEEAEKRGGPWLQGLS